jgi:hypothetical protein
MDDWHRRVAVEIVSDTPAGARLASPSALAPEAATALEIALGEVRSVITYVLEIARAHRLAASGNVAGDDVWLQLGDVRLRATLNRREGHAVLAVTGLSGTGRAEARLRWDDDKRAIVDGSGARTDAAALAREHIDGMVSAWRARPASERRPSAHPSDFEDEPTKG